jgi:hypothetical protein
MVRENEIRKAQVAVTLPPTTDAGLMFIGRIGTPWTSRMETPRQGRADGPLCRIEVFEPWLPALAGLAQYERVESALLAAPFPPRSRSAKPGERRDFARHIFTEITSAPEPDRHRDCSSCRYRGCDCNGAWARLPRRHTAARSQTRSWAVHAHRAAAARRFSSR